MYLETLRLINFKNYKNIEFNFNQEINCLVGENGVGKTNVLDAIYYLSLTKSFFNISDTQLILHNQSSFSILGDFQKNDRSLEVKCKAHLNNKKSFTINGKNYDKIKDHIGVLPVVLISPNDTDIIRGISENRRKFIDSVISQLDNVYLENLIHYNHALKQRNALLKQSEDISTIDLDLITTFDQILVRAGNIIHEIRKRFLARFIPILKRLYDDISDHKECIDVIYQSDLNENDFTELLNESRARDVLLRRTTKGIHKDDYRLVIDGYPIKQYASQGQQKSLIVSLKISQFEIFREDNGYKPILLMDDVFDKLDDQRIEKIMNLVAGHTFGQIFVTDARPERTLSIFESIQSDIFIYHIHNGIAEILSS
jgi:DNA replication and repair protein RecF